jgi:hypothetical protein
MYFLSFCFWSSSSGIFCPLKSLLKVGLALSFRMDSFCEGQKAVLFMVRLLQETDVSSTI